MAKPGSMGIRTSDEVEQTAGRIGCGFRASTRVRPGHPRFVRRCEDGQACPPCHGQLVSWPGERARERGAARPPRRCRVPYREQSPTGPKPPASHSPPMDTPPAHLFLIYSSPTIRIKHKQTPGPRQPMPSSVAPATPPQNSLFRERLVVTLLPYFLPITSNYELAQAEIVETLESYGARTRAEMINAARIIALSFAALDLLAEARGDEMPYTLRLRACGYANSLERSCQQEERALAKRLAVDPPPSEQPPIEPLDDPRKSISPPPSSKPASQIEGYRRPPLGRPPPPARMRLLARRSERSFLARRHAKHHHRHCRATCWNHPGNPPPTRQTPPPRA